MADITNFNLANALYISLDNDTSIQTGTNEFEYFCFMIRNVFIDEKEVLQFLQIFCNQIGNLNQMNAQNETALIIAVQWKRYAVVKKLLELKCDINLKGPNGWTALHYAIISDFVQMVQLLLSSNPDILVLTSKGVPLLEFTRDLPLLNKEQIISLLLEHRQFSIENVFIEKFHATRPRFGTSEFPTPALDFTNQNEYAFLNHKKMPCISQKQEEFLLHIFDTLQRLSVNPLGSTDQLKLSDGLFYLFQFVLNELELKQEWVQKMLAPVRQLFYVVLPNHLDKLIQEIVQFMIDKTLSEMLNEVRIRPQKTQLRRQLFLGCLLSDMKEKNRFISSRDVFYFQKIMFTIYEEQKKLNDNFNLMFNNYYYAIDLLNKLVFNWLKYSAPFSHPEYGIVRPKMNFIMELKSFITNWKTICLQSFNYFPAISLMIANVTNNLVKYEQMLEKCEKNFESQ